MGFTLLELCIVIMAVLVIAGILLPAIMSRPRVNSRQVKDSSQVRGLMQGFVVFAQNNNEDYPNLGKLDKDNATTAEIGSAKNHSANIWSIMIYNGFVPVDLLVSPAEADGNISAYTNYQFNNPTKASDPAHALWDPAFTVDFTKSIGGTSYATNIPTASRLPRWKNTFNGNEVLLANRGPRISDVSISGSSVSVIADPNSLTYQIHGSRTAWEGNFGFNDNHVDFHGDYTWSGLNPKPMYTTTAGNRQIDIPFYSEPDDANGDNVYLGIFTTAGDAERDFNAIWD